MNDRLKALVLFSGGGGVDIALHSLGIDVTGIEYIDEIATVARMNGLNTITADVLDVDPADYADVDILHASPPCPNFSQAKADGEESENDILLGAKVAEMIRDIRPRVFTLENVYGYRNSQSWAIIEAALFECGYGCDFWHLNAADYGVPQTRKRMVAVGLRCGKRPYPPTATHVKGGELDTLFGKGRPQWIGWYEAIEDLIPTLPDSEFAPWQLARLPEEITNLLIKGGNASSAEFRQEDRPADTVTACVGGKESLPKAILINPNRTSIERAQVADAVMDSSPSPTIQATAALPRAMLVDGNYAKTRSADLPAQTVLASEKTIPHKAVLLSTDKGEFSSGHRRQDAPAPTVRVNDIGRRRAVLVDGTPNANGATVTQRTGDEPSMTMVASSGVKQPLRALVVHPTDMRTMPIRDGAEPVFTVLANKENLNLIRAYVGYRVVKLTLRAIARLQSFPDDYELPEKKSLGGRILGNAVPPMLYKAVINQALMQCGMYQSRNQMETMML